MECGTIYLERNNGEVYPFVNAETNSLIMT